MVDGIRSPFHFDGIMRQAIHELKYRNLKSISNCLAELLFLYLKDNPLPGEVLVSVPLHDKRLRQRGYNQTSLIATKLSRLTSIPVVEGCLIRLENSSPQTRSSTVEERRRNVENAFGCRDERLAGKRVLLIDDVCTSGATLDACAKALKAGGTISVWGLTLARET
ncbi:MAG: ComF family protein [Candidatus Omnitrophota bacterium]|nr:MAG: ComF family protein [Candidatus Omnitrophota bacterium]